MRRVAPLLLAGLLLAGCLGATAPPAAPSAAPPPPSTPASAPAPTPEAAAPAAPGDACAWLPGGRPPAAMEAWNGTMRAPPTRAYAFVASGARLHLPGTGHAIELLPNGSAMLRAFPDLRETDFDALAPLPGTGLVVGSADAHAGGPVAFDPRTGRVAWSRDEPGRLAVPPEGTDAPLVLTGRLQALALDPRDGTTRWTRTHEHGYAAPAAFSPDGATAYVLRAEHATAVFHVLALDARTGEERWNRTHDHPQEGALRPRDALVTPDGATLVVSGRAYRDGSAYPAVLAVDAATGDLRWSRLGAGHTEEGAVLRLSADGAVVSAFDWTWDPGRPPGEAYEVHRVDRRVSNGAGVAAWDAHAPAWSRMVVDPAGARIHVVGPVQQPGVPEKVAVLARGSQYAAKVALALDGASGKVAWCAAWSEVAGVGTSRLGLAEDGRLAVLTEPSYRDGGAPTLRIFAP